jgi:hypothetical protein
MISELVNLLTARRRIFCTETDVCDFFESAVGCTCEGKDGSTFFLRQFGGDDDIRRSAAGRNGPENIAFVDQRLDLPCEYIFITIII